MTGDKKYNVLMIGLFCLFLGNNCVKESKNIEDWSVQKRLDRGDSISELLESYQIHDILGNTAEGGILFHLNIEEQYGLVFYPEVIAHDVVFGCQSSYLSNEVLASGQENTDNLLSICDSIAVPAFMCDTFQGNGYTDWFLPSANELELFVQLIVLEDIKMGQADEKVWSSSTHVSESYYTTYSNHFPNQQERDSTASVVPVRKFDF